MLKLLPSDVQSRLRSDIAITSVAQCVEELVLNSLDAGAVCIAIRVDMTCYTVQIVDNGVGISKDDLKLVGRRYSTSKCHKLEDLDNLEYFGYRGEALASLRDISTALEIHSRSRQSSITYCKLFKHGKGVDVVDSKYPRPCPGTTITVHNLFYNLPVRQLNIIDGLELERIRYRVEGIALMNPSISFSLRNDATGHVLLQTQKSNSVLTAFMYLFGGGLSKFLKPVALTKDCFRLEGYISKDGHNKKNLQFVYVNGRLVLKTKVHKMVTKAMSNCLLFRKKRGEWKNNGTPIKSPLKYGDKYSIFVINVKCPYNSYDITFDPRKTLVEFKDWDTLTNAVDELVMNFLKAENLLSTIVKSVDIPENTNMSNSEENTPFTPDDNEISKMQIEDKDENKRSEDLEISTYNTNNSLFSKTVQRQPVASSSRDRTETNMEEVNDQPLVEVNNNVNVSVIESNSQTALEEAADKLQLQITPCDKEFTSEDEIPISAGNKETYYRNVKSSSSSTLTNTTSDNDSEDDLNEQSEDPLPNKVLNETRRSEKSTKTQKNDLKEDKCKFISLPTKNVAAESAIRKLRPNTTPNNDDVHVKLTAAQKISAKLKERHQITLIQDERQQKISSSLDKFRKRNKLNQTTVTTELEEGRDANSNGLLKEPAFNAPRKNTVRCDQCTNKLVTCASFGGLFGRQIDSGNLQTNGELHTTNFNNNFCHSEAGYINKTKSSLSKRTNLAAADGSSVPKKSKFMTSESFVMTPRTAFIQVRSLLKKMESGDSSTESDQPQQMLSSQVPSYSSQTHENLQPNAASTSYVSIEESSLLKSSTSKDNDRNFKVPLPVFDHSMRNAFTSFRATSDKAINLLTTCSSKPVEEKNQSISQSFTSCSDCDLTIETEKNDIKSSQGFEAHVFEEVQTENDIDRLQNYESQCFSFGIVKESQKEKSILMSDTEKQDGYSMPSATEQSFSTILEENLSSTNVDQVLLTDHVQSSLERESTSIPCGQIETFPLQTDSYSITDILSDISDKSPKNQCELDNSKTLPTNDRANKSKQDVLEPNVVEQKTTESLEEKVTMCRSDDLGNNMTVGGEIKEIKDLDVEMSNSEGNTLQLIASDVEYIQTLWIEMKDDNTENNKPKDKITETKESVLSLDINESEKLQDMITQHFDDSEDKFIKWRSKTSDDSSVDPGKTSVNDMFESWENPICERVVQSTVNAEVQHTSRPGLKSYQSLHQIIFTKDMLSCMEVLGQVDIKFIACLISTPSNTSATTPNLLVMMDQHAAHERVRLEQFTAELFEDDDCDVIKRSDVTPPISLDLTPEIVRVVNSFQQEFQRIGIKFSGNDKNRNQIKLHTIPACIVEREANELKRGKRSIATEFVQELISEHVEYLQNTSGARRRLPLALHKILATKACKGAIKFNDNLSKRQCQELITALSKCDLPFQCAHGRPSVIPLFELDQHYKHNNQVKPRPRLDNLMKGINLTTQ
ncbi:DNA mismatch repair protein Mlh3 isoform X2 [Patella vulgata]|uniref:DNA mismatch repair protein Mlh3 isoform X2 n=1 Tax=Patella vulgata TaxID=6465 RepID=UPI0024A8229B|nr:DNA mismatch repair protein Mlh3 isoform X2 [Patella vulgata]